MNKEKILIVDDEQDMLTVLDRTFTGEGYSVATATSAKSLSAALSLTTPDYPDLIVLDLDLPDMDGREIAVKLKEHPVIGNIPILFLTALFSKGQECEKGHMLEGNALLSKPYEIEELMATVKQILNENKVTV
jgi:CheY-like chemotaxis protein